MSTRILFIVLLILPGCVAAQHLSINLSPKHAQKLNAFESGHKRLLKYYKYYKQDSAQTYKKVEKKYKNILDSAIRAQTKQERLVRRLNRKGIALPKELAQADRLSIEMKHWYTVLKDSTSSDSLKQVAKVKVKELAIEKAKQYPGFQNLMDQYHLSGAVPDWKTMSKQVPGLDTLSGLFESKPEDLFAKAEAITIEKISQTSEFSALGKELTEVEKLKALPDQYKQQYEKYTDKDYVKKEGKEKAVEEAVDYFAKHADKLQAAQQKVSKLLSKYKSFSNSNDLSDAVKHTSMEGKTFWEHLVIGGTFNVISTDPVSIDFSPQLGYKFSTKFFVGIGMNYRVTFGDSIKNSYYISPNNTSFKAFASYDLIKSFYAYTEWEKSGISLNSKDKTAKAWKDNYFIGLGRRFLIHPKLYLTLTALYNLNGEKENPVHPHRFQLRVGFQLSELATRKQKVYYNPNR